MDDKQKRTFRRRYMKDYELQTELNDAGREVKVARYVGSFYELGLTEPGLLALRRRCVALSLGAAAAALTALFLRHGAMASVLAILPLAFCMFPLFYGCLGSFHLPRTEKPLRSDEVEYGIERARHSAPAIALLGGLAAVGTWGDGAFLLCCLLVSLCGGLLWGALRPVKITERPREAKWAEE